jgi:DNA-binding protein HU-beta
MPKMTKAQIVAALAGGLNLKKTEVNAFLHALHALAVKEVKKNGEFVLGDFGKLVKAKRTARMGRNPATGETIKIPAKTVLKFRLSKATNDALVK